MKMAAACSSCHNSGAEYPYPSHVCAPNFVTVKLSGREKYSVWKTQMLCLLESHDMLGFITPAAHNSFSGKEKAGDYSLWRRSDALVKGWILGSLSEHALMCVVIDTDTSDFYYTVKDVWDKLKIIYGPPGAPLITQHATGSDLEKEEEEITVEENSISEDTNLSKEEETDKRRKEADEMAKVHQSLYEAILSQSSGDINLILNEEKVKATDKITINGNTTLHVAVGTTKNMELIDHMLNLATKDKPQLDMRNSEGSTLLHVAAIVGNLDAAKILVEKNHDLLFAKDNEGHTPLARALSNMHTETCLYLLNHSTNIHDIEMDRLFDCTSGDELLVKAISSKDYHSALVLSKHYQNLHSDSVLMAIAQNFPQKLNIWDRTFYTCLLIFIFNNSSYYVVLFIMRHTLINFTNILLELILVISIFVAAMHFKLVKKGAQTRHDATYLSKSICNLIKDSKDSASHHYYYTDPVLEATRQNAYEVVVKIVSFFLNAIWSVNEDGHNIIQCAVINRSEKVYNLLYQMSEHKKIYRTTKDPFENNLLHLAARLAPTNKLNLISGVALQIQRELQWFKEVEGFVCPLNIIQKNSFGETPQMVFIREHKELVIEGEKWMKTTAESYTITTALITTIVFAAAITVPGGSNQETGIPIFTNKTAFKVFAVSDAISLFTSVTSLLMFFSILTTRFAEQDFLFKLPNRLIIGLATLFVSTTAMIIAFGAALFLVFGQSFSWILVPIGALSFLPITSFVTLQFPLITELMSSTYGRSIFGKKRGDPFY
ncbi:hypothetical protein SSX86_004091 [Deinandra increscens subsp. villosa]|uniref:PGG domain-containing protein n=1 Tax=Deinandra increscens subsp. villosa TaxID=3103831 RepID=A0AAP0H8Q1_9ASTR